METDNLGPDSGDIADVIMDPVNDPPAAATMVHCRSLLEQEQRSTGKSQAKDPRIGYITGTGKGSEDMILITSSLYPWRDGLMMAITNSLSG